MKAKIVSVIIACIGINMLAAQNVEFEKENFPTQKDQFKDAVRELKDGDELFEQGEAYYTQALEHYLKANYFNPNNAMLNYRIGKCYVIATKKRTSAIPYLEKALKLNPYIDKEARFYLGKAYHYNMEWDKAINEYKEALRYFPPNEQDMVNKKIAECETGKELVKTPTRVFIDNLGNVVNSKFSEYSPNISADESMMIFTSRRNNTTGETVDEFDGDFCEDIYISYNVNGQWGAPINPGKPLNSEQHDASVALSVDGQKLFIYKGDNGGDIYECVLKGNEWSKPERLRKTINTEFHESSASFTYDGRTIYFVSDNPGIGGYGGRDIYMSQMDIKGKWNDPVNLGPVINSKYDEEAVFIHPDGKTLYFASKGHKTMGEFDMFKSVFENGRWSEPENLGYPINTPDNDAFLSVSASGKHAYYSSAKEEGFGGQDIYMVTFLGPEKQVILNSEDNLLASLTKPIGEIVIEKAVEIAATPITILKGKILDEVTQQPVYAIIEITDNEKNESVASFESNSSTGKYLVSLPSGKNYGIAVKSDNYLFHSENIDIKASNDYQEIKKDIYLKKIDIGKKIVLNNIFFDYAKATLRPESAAELDRLAKLMIDNPSLRIEISGHTDNQGSYATNIKLSTERAKAVVDYLIKKDIQFSRLEYKGYAYDQPIASNDTDEGRQLNRRTEFKILSK